MIRIRPGRSWRLNPGYVRELRSLDAPRARAFDGAGILDVLGIEVDGVDIAAGVGEARILVAMDELLHALLRLNEGAAAAQATIGPGPAELVLESMGADVRVALVSLRPPARLLVGGLLLDGARLRSAAGAAARGIARDLFAISPLLGAAKLLRRLEEAAAAVERPVRPARPWPEAVEDRAFVARGGTGEVRCEVQIAGEAAARLASRASAVGAPLAPLLGRGPLALRIRGAPALTFEAPIYLELRNLLRGAAALVQAWESAERSFTLRFGPSELRCDLLRQEVRAPGWRASQPLSPLRLAAAIAVAAVAYVDKGLRVAVAGGATAPRQADDDPLRDLRWQARALLRHCRDLATGELRRTPEAASAPPRNAPRPEPDLGAGRLRRLLYREGWRQEAGPLAPGGLLILPQVVALVSQRSVAARDLATGRLLWRAPCAGGLCVHLFGGADLVIAARDHLACLDPATGTVRWRRRMAGGRRLWALPGCVLRDTPEGVARIDEDGALSFQARLPEGALTHVAQSHDLLLCATSTGMIQALDATGGRPLWKRRAGARTLALALSSRCALALAEGEEGGRRLVAFAAEDGKRRWVAPLHASARDLLLAGEEAVVLGERGALAISVEDGSMRPLAGLPFVPAAAAVLPEAADDSPASSLLFAGPRGVAARMDSRNLAWSLHEEGDAPPAAPLVQRGVALFVRDGVSLHDVRGGLCLARFAFPRPGAVALGADLSVAIADEGGAVSLHRLTTHLSLL